MIITPPPAAAAEGHVADMYSSDMSGDGFVFGHTQAMAVNPEAHAAFETLIRAVVPSIGMRVYEAATLGAAREIGSAHCLLAHGRKSLRAGVVDEAGLAAFAADDDSAFTASEQVVIRYSAKLSSDAASMTDADTLALRDAGYSDRQIVDITLAAAARNYFSRALLALAVPVDVVPGLDPAIARALLRARWAEQGSVHCLHLGARVLEILFGEFLLRSDHRTGDRADLLAHRLAEAHGAAIDHLVPRVDGQTRPPLVNRGKCHHGSSLVGAASPWTSSERAHDTDAMTSDRTAPQNPRRDDRADGRDETPNERADRNWVELLQELRVMQTGTQILTGFLLAVAFQPRFTDMDEVQRDLYVVLVALAAVATILALTPVGMHRALFGRQRKPDLVRVASRIVKIDLVVIGALTIGVTTLIIDFTVDRTAGIIALIAAVVGVLGLWIALPRIVRRVRGAQKIGP
ncbi:MAG: DUF6328 family protein [Microbacterium sp.]|uniref:DUF6328 family protein n=1 Tax=Microbacterium sp. TaxID=51671 RepID=UPI003BB1252E